MKKFCIVIVLSLITNISYAATEKVYLKCEKIITENKSTTLVDVFAEGKFVQIVLTEIIIGNKSSKITVYEPFPDLDDYKESFNKKFLDMPAVAKQKAKVTDNSYSVVDKFSGKSPEGNKMNIIMRYTFTKDGDVWSLKNKNLLREEGGVDINYISAGKCVVVDKKYYKNILKKGPSEADYSF